jgi:N-acetyl-anhydromuramyl-L-alanine amidase AmpD
LLLGAGAATTIGTYLFVKRYRRKGYITINGQNIPTSFPVNHSLKFPIGTSGTMPRTQPVTVGVLHWAAFEDPGNYVFDLLSQRGISTHFSMDRDGTLWQFADPGTTTALNAGHSLGQKSWSIEISNYGMAPPDQIPVIARDRPTYQAPIHGRMRQIADFYPVQYRNLYELVDIVHEELNIPKEVVVEPVEFVPWERLGNAQGLIAHYHAARNKKDPGPRLMQRMARRWGWRATVI